VWVPYLYDSDGDLPLANAEERPSSSQESGPHTQD
jgi:hypothetical protein